MIFKPKFTAYTSRWYGFVLLFFFFPLSVVVWPLSFKNSLNSLGLLKIIFMTDIRITSIFVMPIIALQIFLYFASQKYAKTLEIDDEKIILQLFSGKTEIFYFKDLAAVDRTPDYWKKFIFKTKDGKEKIIVSGTIAKREDAYQMMLQNLEKVNRN